MQDAKNNCTNGGVVRVYPPGTKRLGKKQPIIHQGCDDTSDTVGDTHARFSTPSRIDLPLCDVQANTTQALGQNSVGLPMASFERKSESYCTYDSQSKSSGELFSDKYLEMNFATSNTVFLRQDSHSVLHGDELQGTVGWKGKTTRERSASKSIIELEDRGSSHAESDIIRNATCMKKKVKKNERKRSPYTKKLKRPQYQIVKFLEDYTEFGADLKDMFEERGKHCPTVLESTVDGSIVKGARRSYGSRSSSSIDTAMQNINYHQDSLIALDKCGLKTEQHKYKCSLCEVTSRKRQDVEEHITAMGTLHSEAVVLVLLGSQARGQNCPICSIRFTRLQLFKHIRSAHRNCFPLRCGYCVFFGQDYYQLRHHIRKKHDTSKYHIIDMSRLLAGEEAMGDELERKKLVCPLCSKTLKTLSNLKKHITQHSRKKQQCSQCSFVTTFPTQIRSHYHRKHPSQIPHWQTIFIDKGSSNFLVEDVTPYLKLITEKYGILQPKEKGKLMRQYRCPHCEYTCSFNSSYNRHVRLHSGVKPYKCGYCDFHARETYVIKKHCSTAHKGRKPVIEDGKNFKAPYRYGTQSKGELEKSRHFLAEEVADVKKLQRSISPEPQNIIYTSASAPQSGENPPIEKLCYAGKSKICETLSGHKDYSHQNFRISLRQCKSQSSKAAMMSQLWSSLNNTPLYLDMRLNKKNSVPEETKCSIANNSLLTNPVKHLHFENSAQDGSPRELHGLRKAKQDGTIYSNAAENEQSLRTVSSVDKCNFPVLKQSPVKVKTMKKCELPSQIDTFQQNAGKQCKKVIDNLDSEIPRESMPNVSSQVSVIMRQEERSSNIMLTELPADSREKTVVIFLRENRFGDTCIDKIEKIRHNSCPDAVIQSSSNNEALARCDTDLHIEKKNCAIQREVVLRHENARHSKYNWHHASNSKGNSLKHGSDSLEHGVSKRLLGREMETHLDYHTSYLSDMQVQCLSNHTPATPGIMKFEHLDESYTNNDYFSTDEVRLMMQKEDGRARCRKCGVTTTYRAFYKHAKKHFNVKPFKCGYCSYRSIEKSKVRVHNTFCHPSHPPLVLKLSPEFARVNCNTSSVCALNFKEKNSNRGMLDMLDQDECKRLHRDDLTNFSHSSCNISSLKAKPAAFSSRATQSVFQCPLCSKSLQKHTPSVRRHLYSHYSYKPYKCGYCSYMGIGQSEIRAHHVTHGLSVPPKVEDSGVPMPSDLTIHINNIFPFHHQTKLSHKEKQQADLKDSVHNGMEAVQGPSVWKESSNAVKDVTTIHSSSQNETEENLIFSSDQKNLEAYDSTSCSLSHALECDALVSESSYAVQVLENVDDASTSNTFPSQLNSESVCVVYLVE